MSISKEVHPPTIGSMHCACTSDVADLKLASSRGSICLAINTAALKSNTIFMPGVLCRASHPCIGCVIGRVVYHQSNTRFLAKSPNATDSSAQSTDFVPSLQTIVPHSPRGPSSLDEICRTVASRQGEDWLIEMVTSEPQIASSITISFLDQVPSPEQRNKLKKWLIGRIVCSKMYLLPPWATFVSARVTRTVPSTIAAPAKVLSLVEIRQSTKFAWQAVDIDGVTIRAPSDPLPGTPSSTLSEGLSITWTTPSKTPVSKSTPTVPESRATTPISAAEVRPIPEKSNAQVADSQTIMNVAQKVDEVCVRLKGVEAEAESLIRWMLQPSDQLQGGIAVLVGEAGNGRRSLLSACAKACDHSVVVFTPNEKYSKLATGLRESLETVSSKLKDKDILMLDSKEIELCNSSNQLSLDGSLLLAWLKSSTTKCKCAILCTSVLALPPQFTNGGVSGYIVHFQLPDAKKRKKILFSGLHCNHNHEEAVVGKSCSSKSASISTISPSPTLSRQRIDDVTQLVSLTAGSTVDEICLLINSIKRLPRDGTVSLETKRTNVSILDHVDRDLIMATAEEHFRNTASKQYGVSVIGADAVPRHLQWDIGCWPTELKSNLERAVLWPLTKSERMEKLGVSAPKGVLMYGRPGGGKTASLRSCCAFAGVPVIAVDCATVFSSFTGGAEEIVRSVFSRARAMTPCVVFLDEVDSLATNRQAGSNTGGGEEVRRRVLSTLLNEMDGVGSTGGVVVVGATNRKESLDPALVRPGRLESHVHVQPPSHDMRLNILTTMLESTACDDDIDLDEVAAATEDYMPADIAGVVQRARMACLRNAIRASDGASSVAAEHSKLSQRELLAQCSVARN